MRGIISTIDNSYLHADTEVGRIFVNANDCDFLICDARMGDVLELGRVYEGPRGLRGERVTFVERPAAGDFVEGTITGVQLARGFAFARPDDGGAACFLHCRQFIDYRESASESFRTLSPGDRVAFMRVPGCPAPRAEHIGVLCVTR